MLKKIRSRVITFLDSKKETPIIAAIAAGLYPLVYYYYKNFSLLNSSVQFFYFLFYFLVLPILVFKLTQYISFRVSFLKITRRFIVPFLNFSWFIFLMLKITIGLNSKTVLIGIVIALIVALLLSKHFKKIIVFQLVLACVVFVSFINFMLFHAKSPDSWLTQPDSIEEVIFKKKPNIYIIQPDGYANTSEINKGYYNFNNKDFENFLKTKEFKIYEEFRSNYYSTLSSNSSLFSMKHHYYNYPTRTIRETFLARDVIVGENPVLRVLKNNNYKTHLLLEKSYLLYNRPNVYYDYSNISLDELPYFPSWSAITKDIKEDLKVNMELSQDTANFFFLELMSPSHITNRKSPGNIADVEREIYIDKLKKTNLWLEEVVSHIVEKDKNSLIVIVADHGGFVGMNSTRESRMKLEDNELVNSVFTSQLAIKWPEEIPEYDYKLKTTVNLFRVLFSYLSENENYLDSLQEDKSYLQIERGAPFGVYEVINEKGDVVFNKKNK